ncbi:uncharacterized protein LOC143061965 [Mytilus galloprovincialis]|uniref:uncharacterized protein LOC143061965 n=1 Tax=Mytilus galloprovincialis TaxID=29158 RepID=UPI003F7BC619
MAIVEDASLEHLQMLLGDNKELPVRRQSILTDVIQAYEDPQLVGQRLVIRFEGELGQDAGGLTKDLFSAFWDAAFKTYFVGERCCVPFLSIHRFSESSIFPILGRILTHGTALTGVFPIRLCRSSVFSIIHGTPCENEEMLLSDLLMYLTDFEPQVSKTALEDLNIKLTPRTINHLTDMFIRFGVSILPKADTFRQLMVNLARFLNQSKPQSLTVNNEQECSNA